MKSIIAAMTAAWVLAGLAAVAPAQAHSDQQSYQAKKSAQKKRIRYVEYLADRQRFGSKIWWEQMDREDRGGRRR